MSAEVRTTTCYMCACRCGIRVHLRDGEIRYIDGNPEHPLNKGVICAKGASGIMKQVSPARLTRPLRATRACGRSRRWRPRPASSTRGSRRSRRARWGGSFNTREFFHGRPRELLRAVRRAFLALGFPIPALLLAFADTPPGLLAAFLLQSAGLLAERWTFLAEARHPQNLYYQAIA
jgi:hypothetical protein